VIHMYVNVIPKRDALFRRLSQFVDKMLNRSLHVSCFALTLDAVAGVKDFAIL